MTALIDYLQQEYISLTEIIRDFELSEIECIDNGRYYANTPNGDEIWFCLATRKCGYVNG